MRTPPAFPRAGRGFSLVELVVAMAIMLGVAAAALGLPAIQLQDTRRSLAEARLTQDLRTAADLIARDLARAGHGLPTPAAPADPWLQATGDGVSIAYANAPSASASSAHVGYRLRRGSVEMALGEGSWQALTDASTMRVTGFHVDLHADRIGLASFCSRPCTANACPYQLLRQLTIRIEAQALPDTALRRSAQVQARVHNDAVVGACPA